uniref:4-hydroxy-3-methylbut-2-enyl diphosphate reductase n=1 Tax=Phaeomonas parva TaxID=124430 RepID=A0A6U4E9P0_9STRA|mmetsp:Transcript_19546/g.59137  ORF Transcript_19546/g.59137 Transcript_19546/m.59137 type:complete len:437 (+) Transcript_19546:102-1412(+)
MARGVLVAFLALGLAGVRGFRVSPRMSTADRKVVKKDERRRISGKDTFYRRGFKDVQDKVSGIMEGEFKSDMLEGMRTSKYERTVGDVTIKMAEHLGFCWGVERAVAMALETREHFPEDELHITNEIIHNPQVNEMLTTAGVQIIPKEGVGAPKDFSKVKENDVVILPAFGASLEEMQFLDDKGVRVVDATCPWVSKVWNTVDRHQRMDMTSVIHGKWNHEETIATASFCETYLIMKNEDEAKYVANYIVNGGDKAEFLEKFKNAMSEGFDPDTDLEKVGLANQTTMYKRETRQIGRIMEKALMSKFGAADIGTRYAEFDTICDATQERQDAITDLIEDGSMDFILIVGGFDSSNTAHLKEIPELAGIKSYHIDRAERILADGSIEHRLLDGSIVTEENFLPEGKITIGVTSGASTPDAYLGDAVDRILMLKKLNA